MDRADILGYLELFRELGLLFEDEEIAHLLRDHLQKTFHEYSLGQLFKVFKLHSNNFYRDDPETIRIIEDAVKIRASEPEQRAGIRAAEVRDLIEGLRLHIQFNKRLDASLRSIIKSTPVLDADKQLFVQFLTYAADFDIKIDDALKTKLQSALEIHTT
jgi:hypothetical protein